MCYSLLQQLGGTGATPYVFPCHDLDVLFKGRMGNFQVADCVCVFGGGVFQVPSA